MQNLEELKRYYENLEKALLNKTHIPIDEALKLVEPLNMRYGILMSDAPSLSLYRIRIIERNRNEDLSSLKTFSYPPIEHTSSYQRANIPGYPVFYGATDGKTAFEEIFSQISDRSKVDIYISEWELTIPENYFVYTLLNRLYEEGHLLNGFSLSYSKTWEEMKNETQDAIDHYFDLGLFIGKQFISGNYILTGSIAHEIIYNTKFQNHRGGMLLYPSCSNQQRTFNVALRPDIADDPNILTFKKVYKVDSPEIKEEGASYKLHFLGELVNNKIEWSQSWSELKEDKYTVAVDCEMEKSSSSMEELGGSILKYRNNQWTINDFIKSKFKQLDPKKIKTVKNELDDFLKEEQNYLFQYITFDGGAILNIMGKDYPIEVIRVKYLVYKTWKPVSLEEVKNNGLKQGADL